MMFTEGTECAKEDRKSSTSSIFKLSMNPHILYDVLDKITVKDEKGYTMNENSFKLLQYYKDTLYTDFIEQLVPYYHISKRHYLHRELTYNAFTTIMRQICKGCGIPIQRRDRYDVSKYNVEYKVGIL
jgi:hypothetical protein